MGLNEVPSVYPPNYYKSDDFYLWIIVIAMTFIGAYIFWNRTKKSGTDIQKSLFFGISGMMIFLGVMRIFYLYAVILGYDNYDFWTNLGYISGMTGMTILLYAFEKTIIKKTHYLLTIISTIGAIMGILSAFKIVPRHLTLSFIRVVATLDTLLILILYFYLVIKTIGVLKRKVFLSFLGIISLFMGNTLDSEMIFSIWPTMPLELAPSLMILGIIMLTYFQKPE
ncbi:MAG: hypothetical protein ACTSU2_02150 [Promethearchaeota archaeon]